MEQNMINENNPAKETDVTNEQGAELATVATVIKTAAEQAEERKSIARKAAKESTVKKYSGKVAEFLKARTVTENENGKQAVQDFSYSWKDENGQEVTAAGKVPVTAILSSDAAKNFRECAKRVQSEVVAFHVADATGKAKIRAAVEKDVNKMFTFLAIPAERAAKKSEVADILESAYFTNANGDNDASGENAIVWTVSAVVRRILKGRDNAIDADKTRKDAATAAAKAKEVKAA